jgi:hypothetical protein
MRFGFSAANGQRLARFLLPEQRILIDANEFSRAARFAVVSTMYAAGIRVMIDNPAGQHDRT